MDENGNHTEIRQEQHRITHSVVRALNRNFFGRLPYVYASIHSLIHISILNHLYIHASILVHRTNMFIHTYIHSSMYIHTHIHTCVHIYTCTFTHMYNHPHPSLIHPYTHSSIHPYTHTVSVIKKLKYHTR